MVRNFRWRDAVQLVLAVLIYSFLFVTFTSHPALAICAALVYSFVNVLILSDIIKGRRSRDYAQAAVLREFFSYLGREVLSEASSYRITVFRQSPFDTRYIVPWYRYSKNDGDLVASALHSRAKYRKNEGYTGEAWSRKGRVLICASFPDFEDSRELFEAYYVDQLGIDQETVRDLSDSMVRVRTIFSYAFEGTSGEFLGVLSIDLDEPITFDEQTKISRIGKSHLYGDSLVQTLRSINIALQGFANANRKQL